MLRRAVRSLGYSGLTQEFVVPTTFQKRRAGGPTDLKVGNDASRPPAGSAEVGVEPGDSAADAVALVVGLDEHVAFVVVDD